jgi:DNA polymerase III alpha subunit (gram-positive type)
LSYVTAVAFDVETTGLLPEVEDILEVAAVKFTFDPEKGLDGIVDLGSYTSLVKPTKKIPFFITEINNIDDEMVKDAPPLGEVLPKFLRFCGISSILVAHNASFDASFIGRGVRKCAMPMPLNPVFDSLKMIKKIMPEFNSYKLKEIARKLDGQTALTLDFVTCLKKRFSSKDLLQHNAVKELTKVHGKPIAFMDFAS